MTSNGPLRPATPWVWSYGLAVGSVAIALGLALLADFESIGNLAISLFLVAIAVSVWFAGTGPGVLAIALSTLAFEYFFAAPRYNFYVLPAERPTFVVFILFALLIGWFSARRRRVELDLRRAREQLQAEVAERTRQASLLDLTHDTIFVRDMSDVITYWNRGAQELYGWTSTEAIGKHADQLLQTIFAVPIDEIRTELLRAGRWEGELSKTKAGGTRVIVASRWSLQRDEAGQPVAILETNNDVTERKRGEEEIQKLHADLERRTVSLEVSNRELEAFAYSTSHDLRAPLRHTVGYTELLRKSAFPVLDEKSRHYVMMILDSAKKMGALIDDLLAFSRIGRAEAQTTLVSLGQLAQEVSAEIQGEAAERRIVWKIGALPDIQGDRAMLRLALTNLVSNAVKFTRTRPEAEIEIGCADGKEDEVVVFIRDNGVGFDMKYADKLFGVFQRLHRTEDFEGTGVGLATVQRIAARHGGRAWAEGTVDHGATFYFSARKTRRAEA